jgi:hypothetical protein
MTAPAQATSQMLAVRLRERIRELLPAAGPEQAAAYTAVLTLLDELAGVQHEITGLGEQRFACTCGRVFTSANGIVACPDAPARPLPLIGHDRVLVEGLARLLHDRTPYPSTVSARLDGGRGWWYDAALTDPDGQPTGRIARVTVALDRVEQVER